MTGAVEKNHQTIGERYRSESKWGETPTETATQTATPTPTATETPQNEVPSEVTDWLSDVGNYDRTVADRTGQSEATSELVSEAGHTFEQAFESAGVVTYFCTPHKGTGMKGAIIVG